MAEDKHLHDHETAPESPASPDAPDTTAHGAPDAHDAGTAHGGARRTINNNSPVVMVIAIVVLAAAVGYIWYSMQTPQYSPQPVYYYDLGTGELFNGMSDQIPPVDAPSGANQGVRAYVYSCGSCNDPSQRFIAYLETHTPEAKAAMTGEASEDEMMDPVVMDEGHRVRAADGETWYSTMSDEGMQIVESVTTRCGPMKQANPCLPEGS